MNSAKTARYARSWMGARRAFTLIELLIVIGIIGILVGIVAVLGTKVIGGGKASAAADTIRVLDAVLTEYESVTNAPAPAMFEHKFPAPNGSVLFQYAIVDARPAIAGNYERELRDNEVSGRKEDPAVASMVRFTAMANEATSVQSVLKQINQKFVRTVQVHPKSDNNPPQNRMEESLTGLKIIDPWGYAIRAVHPSFDGGYGDFGPDNSNAIRSNQPGRDLRSVTEQRGSSQNKPTYRRSFRPYPALPTQPTYSGDADEGICPNKRMYFYSCGADGNPGSRADNVYTTRPTFPQETAKY